MTFRIANWRLNFLVYRVWVNRSFCLIYDSRGIELIGKKAIDPRQTGTPRSPSFETISDFRRATSASESLWYFCINAFIRLFLFRLLTIFLRKYSARWRFFYIIRIQLHSNRASASTRSSLNFLTRVTLHLE